MKNIAALITILLLAWTQPGWSQSSSVPLSIQGQLQRLGNDIRSLEQQVRSVQVEGYIFDQNERYLNAEVSFELGNWNEAAHQFYSLLEDSRFKSDSRYYQAIKMLAGSLYKMGNLEGARDYYEKMVDAGFEAGEALTNLVEIASVLNRKDDLRRYTRQVSTLSAAASDRLIYAHGLALYLIGEFDAAAPVLSKVASGSELFVKARYIIGAILITQNNLDDAFKVFESVISIADPKRDAEVVELANLSLARICYETNRMGEAADYYQKVDRQSIWFQRSLFEMTHVYIKTAQLEPKIENRVVYYRKALEALEILSSTPNLTPKLAIETQILSGRINMFLGMLDYAVEAYRKVVDQFAPMSTELWEFSRDAARIDKWFEALASGTIDSQADDELLSKDATAWVQEEPQLGDVVSNLKSLAAQQKDLDDSKDALEKLQAALTMKGGWSLFPPLRLAWFEGISLESQLLMLDDDILEWEYSRVKDALSDMDKKGLERIFKEKKQLEDKLATAPQAFEAIKTNSDKDMQKLKDMEKDLDAMLVQLERYKVQADSMIKILREVKYSEAHNLQVQDEQLIEGELQSELKVLMKLYQQTMDKKLAVQKEMIKGGGSQAVVMTDAYLRNLLWKLHYEEATIYSRTIQNDSAAGGNSAEMKLAGDLHSTITHQLIQINNTRLLIADRAEKKLAFYKEEVEREAVQVTKNEIALNQTRERALAVAREVGRPLFLAANERLGRVVLEADLGLVDLAWSRKQLRTDEIEALAEEQSEILGVLKSELEDINREGK